jgi:hypothetical protein
MASNGVITDRDRQVLNDLSQTEWLRLLDIGGTNGSHHGSTVRKLIRYGLAEKRPRGGSIGGMRTTWEYRRVDMVQQAIGFVRQLVGYGCAGVDQDVEATTLCGKCAPCEAGAFLDRWGLR